MVGVRDKRETLKMNSDSGVEHPADSTSGTSSSSDAHVNVKHHDDDVFYLFLQKQKIGAKLHIYL